MINLCPNNPDVNMLRNFYYVKFIYIDILERVISKKAQKSQIGKLDFSSILSAVSVFTLNAIFQIKISL